MPDAPLSLVRVQQRLGEQALELIAAYSLIDQLQARIALLEAKREGKSGD